MKGQQWAAVMGGHAAARTPRVISPLTVLETTSPRGLHSTCRGLSLQLLRCAGALTRVPAHARRVIHNDGAERRRDGKRAAAKARLVDNGGGDALAAASTARRLGGAM